MIFLGISFLVGAFLMLFPIVFGSITCNRYCELDYAADICKSNNEKEKAEKLSRKAHFWRKLNGIFDSDETMGEVLCITGISMMIIIAVASMVVIPCSLCEQSDMVAQYKAYEIDYNKWKSGELQEPPFSNSMVLSLQEDIEQKRTFRERHPIMSRYVGHELDDLDCTKFFYNRDYDRVQVDK